jgi:arginyl-tRNA synthetase
MRKAEQAGIPAEIPGDNYVMHQAERELVFALSQYPVKVLAAANEFAPSLISQYAFDLAKVYNQFYAELSIFSDPDAEAVKLRVALSGAVAETIRKALGLLGIDVPERM